MTPVDIILANRPRAVASAQPARQIVALVGAALLGIVLLMLFVDGPVAQAISHWPASVVHIVGSVTSPLKGGYLIVLSVVVTLALFAGFRAARNSARARLRGMCVDAGFVSVATVGALLCATILKVLIGRARPELMALYGPHAFFPFSTSQLLTSFPSGETSMVFTFFAACALVTRRRVGLGAAVLVLAPAFLVAASRPIVGAHYVSDVVAAMLLSTAVIASLSALGKRHYARLSGLRPSL